MEKMISNSAAVSNTPLIPIGIIPNASKVKLYEHILSPIYTLWMFTESNFSTFVLPNTAFGMFGAMAGPLLTTDESPSVTAIVQRLPLVILFNWSNVLIFDLANQRHPESVKEDLANKPWRPLPTGRVSPEQTRRLMLIAVPLVLGWNALFGVWKETALLFILTWLYNDLGGGDEIIRDVIIATAFALYNRGSLKMATSPQTDINERGHTWIAIISAVILTTMQVQDLKDQAGDRGRGRRTLPLVLGHTFSRWTIAAFVGVWSCYCAFFWNLGPWAYVLPLTLAVLIAVRVVRRQKPKEDGATWKLWCLWTAVLYLLPLVSSL